MDSCASEEDKDLTGLDSEQLKSELTSVRQIKKEQEEVLQQTRKELKEVREELVAWQYQCTSACEKLQQQKDVNSMMKREISGLEQEQTKAEKAAEETSKLRKRLQELKNVEDMLEGSESEVEDMLKSYHDSATELAKFLVVLKQNYEAIKHKKMQLQSINSNLTLDLTNMRKAWRKTNDELVQSQNDLSLCREEVKSLDRERSSLQQKVLTLQEAVESPGSRTSLKRMLESPAPEHVVTKKQHNDDLLKELFPDSSDEENEVPSTSTSSVYSNSNDCNSSLIASLGIKNNIAITSFSAKKRKEFANHHCSQDNVLVPIQTQLKPKPEFRRKGYNGLGGQATFTIMPKSGKRPTGPNTEKNQKLKFGGTSLFKKFSK